MKGSSINFRFLAVILTTLLLGTDDVGGSLRQKYRSLSFGESEAGRHYPAHLLVTKQLLNSYLVQNKDVIVKYCVYNIDYSSAPASAVFLEDDNFSEDFQVVAGQTEVQLGRIAPGVNVTHVIVVRPLKDGYFNFTSARVSYYSGHASEDNELIQGSSSEPGRKYIGKLSEFSKKTSLHLFDWVGFILMCLPPLATPFVLWHSSSSKYEALLELKKRRY